ncbi:hypothetical protein [Burkholderia territorii]|uniref:hypothetical protein n=1 Tax=Burkholderia territorii TaxID=1503055 RepID=UPI000B2430A8|nr:hypothetical protein [Burkholderia territorii]
MKVHLLVSNGGDGSYGITFLNDEAVQWLAAHYKEQGHDYDSLGCDGDGFHYETIEVPDGFNIGQEIYGVDDVAGWFN